MNPAHSIAATPWVPARDYWPSAIVSALAALGMWRERTRQRRALAHLDDRLLRDIGVTREQAAQEVRKPFWR